MEERMIETTTAPPLTPASVEAMSDRELDGTLAALLGWQHVELDAYVNFGIGHAKDACGTPPSGVGLERRPVPRYSTDHAAAVAALSAIEALGWEWTLKSYLAENHGGATGERRYLMRAVKAGLSPVDADTATMTRTIAECAALAMAAMKERER